MEKSVLTKLVAITRGKSAKKSRGKYENDCSDALQGAADILKFEVNGVLLTGSAVPPGPV